MKCYLCKKECTGSTLEPSTEVHIRLPMTRTSFGGPICFSCRDESINKIYLRAIEEVRDSFGGVFK